MGRSSQYVTSSSGKVPQWMSANTTVRVPASKKALNEIKRSLGVSPGRMEMFFPLQILTTETPRYAMAGRLSRPPTSMGSLPR